jgi:hypothetical protein
MTNAAARIAGTMAFGGHSKRMRTAVEAGRVAWSAWEHWGDGKSAALRLTIDDGVKPSPLPVTTVRKPAAPTEIGRLQRTYRRLVQLGLHDEAAEVAKMIVADPEPNAMPEVVHAVAIEDSSSERIQAAGLQRPSSDERVHWSAASAKSINCSFDGADIEKVAKHFQQSLGCVVRVDGPEGRLPRVSFSCRELPAHQALGRIVESCGWTIAVERDAVVLRPPMLLPLRAERLPILR